MTIVERARAARDRFSALPMWVLDAAVATFLVIAGYGSATSDPIATNVAYEPLDLLGYVLIAAITVPYYLRRQYPLTAFLVSTVALVTYVLLDYHEGALPIVALIGVYTVGAYATPRRVVVGFAAMIIALVVLRFGGAPSFDTSDLFANIAYFSVALMFGWAVQSRRERVAALEERTAALEREQEEEALRAVSEERLRIAQELHDVMAHSMSVIAVQAGAGMTVVDDDPAEAKRALENISATSRETLGELRRLLGVLRSDTTEASYAPAHSLDELPALAEEISGAGVPVAVTVEGDLSSLPPGVGLTGYRIVQEALTNVLKHAGPASASVLVRHGDGALRIQVTDDGRGVNGRAPRGGHGLLGMRERVAVYGGSLSAGPRAGGGFEVIAELPYGASL